MLFKRSSPAEAEPVEKSAPGVAAAAAAAPAPIAAVKPEEKPADIESGPPVKRRSTPKVAELRKELPRAQLINTKMLELSRDLVLLAKRDPIANQIIREFNLRLDSTAAAKKKEGS